MKKKKKKKTKDKKSWSPKLYANNRKHFGKLNHFIISSAVNIDVNSNQ